MHIRITIVKVPTLDEQWIESIKKKFVTSQNALCNSKRNQENEIIQFNETNNQTRQDNKYMLVLLTGYNEESFAIGFVLLEFLNLLFHNQ